MSEHFIFHENFDRTYCNRVNIIDQVLPIPSASSHDCVDSDSDLEITAAVKGEVKEDSNGSFVEITKG